MRQTGPSATGARPGDQPQLSMRGSTFGSLAITVIGTSRFGFVPVITGDGWWSPSITMTVFSLPYFSI